ncbi:hypothetical protein [Actinomyces qiguomingii]|uniref:hypothetical protein n=1 Tax=Actinomyces qiguomingii TaxID=2057800 RepID=UPI001E284677|nr:hypothetical protein [Actinomyces qiguomingii]
MNLALCLATVLLVPQTLLYEFPADTSGYVIISETGVQPEEVEQVAEHTGVEVSQVRHITEFDESVDSTPISTTSVEIIGHKPDDYIRPPLGSVFLSESIVYSGSTTQQDALGGWYAIGSADNVNRFINRMEAQWGQKISVSKTLDPGLVLSTVVESEPGRSLLLAQAVLALVLALVTAHQTEPYRYARVLGSSHLHLALDLLRRNLLMACRWLVLPLALVGLIVAYDIYSSAVLSIHRMTAELIVWSAAAGLGTTLMGSVAGWAIVSTESLRRPGAAAYPRHGVALTTYVLAIIMTWSFSTASTTLINNTLQAQAMRNQAQAQQSLPHATSLGLWSVSEHTFNIKTPQLTSLVTQAQKEHRLLLAWAIPDNSTPDGSGPPTLYLNNTAASHYGLPAVNDGEVALYRARMLAHEDSALTQALEQEARFNAQYGGSSGDITVAISDQEDIGTALPARLPSISYFLSAEGTRTSDCLIAVVPDGFFSPDNYVSAITQGAAVFTERSVTDMREYLREHQVEDLVGRLDTVGFGNTAMLEQTTRTVALHALILLVSAIGAVISTGIAARAWSQSRRRRREISRLLGQRRLTEHFFAMILVAVPLLILARPLLVQSTHELVITQAACALALIAAVVVGARYETARPASLRRRRPTRHD